MNIEQFPEIAKAVSHKYIKRVPKVGGGYRYTYPEQKGEAERTKQFTNILSNIGRIYRDGGKEESDRAISELNRRLDAIEARTGEKVIWYRSKMQQVTRKIQKLEDKRTGKKKEVKTYPVPYSSFGRFRKK